MLARFLLALLMALLSVPAVACAPAPQPATAHHGMKHHAPAEPDRHNGSDSACIGCIAPSAIPAPGLAAPLAYPTLPPVAALSTGIALGAPPPATPPPRAA